ncbi:MAG: nitroreductase family protein [Rhizomicrobium sp.]
MPNQIEAHGRSAQHPVHDIFLERWSPRAFTGEAIPQAVLNTILEAGRWAPSAFNAQPWRFVYARRDTADWDRLFGLLAPFNQLWCRNAAALIFVFSKTTFRAPGKDEDEASRSHAFDAGAAWAHIALQTTLLGWHAHAMLGFDHEAALSALKAPIAYRAQAAIAIGRRGERTLLDEALAKREVPSERLPLDRIAKEGAFPPG